MNIVFSENKKMRLDTFLANRLPLSRSQIQKLIKAGEITVNGHSVPVHNFLVTGDMIAYNEAAVTERATQKPFLPNDRIHFAVVDETPDYLIVNKPSGLMVHPTEHMEPDTLANGLVARYPELATVGDNPVRPGIVHRLDKDVSGLMVIAKNQEAFEYFKHLFQGREIEKEYIALVYGIMEQPQGIIDFPIARSTSGGKMATRSKSQEGKEAVTEWDVITQYRNCALLKVHIHTGRTHQIRTHMLAIQHGVVGDPLYTQKQIKEYIETPRIFLHATRLKFIDMDGNWKEYSAPLPEDLQSVLHALQ